MKRWVLFHQKAYLKPDDTIDYCNYGDWVDGSWIKDSLDKRTTSRPLMSTAYFYNNCRIVARAARLLGKTDDAKNFDDLADKVKAGFNARFFDPKTNKYESETQGSYVFPLAFGLVPEDHQRRGRRQPRRGDHGQAQGPYVGGPGRDAVVHAGADRRGPSGSGVRRRDADDPAELGLHGFQGGDDDLGALGHRRRRTAA